MKHQVTFVSQGLTTGTPDGTTVFNAANWAGLLIDSTCGGHGTCGKCIVRLIEGADSSCDADRRFLSKRQLEEGWRLACRAAVHAECRVEVPNQIAAPQVASIGQGREVALCPNTRKVHLKLAHPSLEDQRADLTRVADALRESGFEARAVPAVWRALPGVLRQNDFSVTAVMCGQELIAVEPGDTSGRNFGLALDIGTTTVAGAVVNLNSGAVEASGSTLNGQALYGADVITRISYAATHEGGLGVLHGRIIETVNQLVHNMLTDCSVAADNLYEAVAVGNATMLHLLLGIDPQEIGVSPFIPAVQGPMTLPAADVGLRLHPGARLSTLPHLGAYVGADIVAGLLATSVVRHRDGKVRLYIDVGTNGEIVLGSGDQFVATAAPAGPAFEDAQIRCRMRATDGAIEHVQITDDLHLQIVGGQSKPIGICGSGLVDALAELRKCRLLEASGRFAGRGTVRGRAPDAVLDRLIEIDGMTAFLLSSVEDGVILTQADVRSLQFAKAAIAAGTRVLMARLGARLEDLQEVLLAGSFGTYINPASARAIGLVPQVPLERIIAVGNAAGEGAMIALLSTSEREAARQLPDYVDYLELSGRSEFNEVFTDSLAFPPGE